MKSALVTGGNRGIGLATCKGLVKLGYKVYLGSRSLSEGEKKAQKCGAIAVELDVTNVHSILSALQFTGNIDVLVNNAGVLGSGDVFSETAEFEDSMSVMLNGPFQLMKLTSPAMVSNDYGRIVNVSSGWGSFSDGLRGPGGYGVAKAALNALTRAAANSLPNTVKVNAVCPGWVRTRMGGTFAPRSPEQGAETILWLATLDSNGPTGGFFRDKKAIPW